jgi:REP element-mobilizing transposase RayT
MRHPRQLREGARYHVTGRINRQEPELEAKAMKEEFLEVVRRAKQKYSFQIENFCIMGNHFHFLIMPAKGECLSDIMRWIMSVFAMRYNKINNFHGHVWGERFFSRIVDGFADYLRIFAYICNNPAKAGCITGSVKKWEYGGAGHYFADRHDILGILEEWISKLYEYAAG